jgi:Ufm1-specific protease 2
MLSVKDLAAMAPEAIFPLHILQVNAKTIGVVRDAAIAILPFSTTAVTDTVVKSVEEAAPLLSSSSGVASSVEFKWCARVTLSVSASSKRHGLLLRNVATNTTASHLLDSDVDVLEKELQTFLSSVETNDKLWASASSKDTPCGDLHIVLASEPAVPDTFSRSLNDLPSTSVSDVAGNLTTRVVLGNSPREVVSMVSEIVVSLLRDGATGRFTETAVCWPDELLFPVNVHTRDDPRRRAEHAALLLPNRGLLHHQNAVQRWTSWSNLKEQRRNSATAANSFRTGESWERHLVTNPHTELSAGAAPSLPGAETLLTSGSYDYYHYRVDGFRDDGWGCAYRSLQTVLSWFQHAGLMTSPMPSIRRIQEILYATDPDKTNKKQFVGSCEWIGSFEVMMVLHHYISGLECTIRRLESGKDLDNDAAVQLLLSEHFRHPHAAPVMIGGSSYAHTILGMHVNVHTMEARYLILDPHYSANPTQLKTALKKGFLGWKEASNFFEAGSWYNLCIPRTDLYDPR